ncbi:MAG TPA: hypothetical protein VIU93_12305 [Gallionellaceae bacterium]
MVAKSPRSTKRSEPGPVRAKLVEAINTPLGFFVLALLIVESFLATVLLGAELESTQKMNCILIGVALFIFVVAIVGLFVWFKPLHLTFDRDAHLLDRGKLPYGTNQNTMSASAALSGQKQQEASQ